MTATTGSLTSDQTNPTHPNPSFAANFVPLDSSIESLRNCDPSITHTQPAEEMEEKEKCQQNSPIGQFSILEHCFSCVRRAGEAISFKQMLKLNRRIAAIKPSATLAADARATEMKLAGIDVISLAAGEPDFDTPEHIKRRRRQGAGRGPDQVHARSGGTAALKNAIKLKLKRDNNLDYEPAEIIASAGCKQAEANVIDALFDEGDEVIIPTPAWVSFAAMVSLSGAEPKFVRCSEESRLHARARGVAPRDYAAHARHHAQLAVESDRRRVRRRSS